MYLIHVLALPGAGTLMIMTYLQQYLLLLGDLVPIFL